ncbi:riboflavin synthase [Amnibacterium kyonggiense]|uniref:Riboflavin synthase n=1 Tax=Amnibacterium kyonggiense TaxID=595671 RepID=A0A4R7FHY4_9MICO|nr:riboflavin synthase [Amnibacterium kyonggiense]TDS75037.1 riboflavin synthase alpha chain [Amnibacterium kyonggiense]
MFTGIIEERGRIVGWETTPDGGARLTIDAPTTSADAHHGDSIAVSGVCLTVVRFGDGRFTADVMGQTLAVSAIADLAEGDEVNLERAAKVGDRLGGHIVQGHVDGVGELLQVRDEGAWRVLRISLPADLAPLVVDKGSIAVAGTSLTVSAIGQEGPAHWFEVSLIPETLQATTLGALAVGGRVNLETDVLARHVARLLALTPASEGMA